MTCYSPDAAKAFLFAIRECTIMGHDTVQAEHLLVGLVNANPDIRVALKRLGFSLERLRSLIKSTNQVSLNSTLPVYSQTLRQILKRLPEQRIEAKEVLKVLLLDPKGQCFEMLSSSADFPAFYRELSGM